MQEVQDEVNKWETQMNTASRILDEKQQWVQQTKTCNTGRGDTPMLQMRQTPQAECLESEKGGHYVLEVQQAVPPDKGMP